MTIVWLRSTVLLLLLSTAVPAGSERTAQEALPPARESSLERHVERLDALVDAVRAARADDRASASRLLSQLPSQWLVTTPEQTWRVPTAPVHSALTDWQAHRDASHQEAVIACLSAMRAQATAFGRSPADATHARARLAEVLGAKEFQGVRGPSTFDRLRRVVIAWLMDLLSRLFGSSVVPVLASVVIYLVIALAVLAGALVLVRALRRTARSEALVIDDLAERTRPWDDWLTQARIAAADGDWPEAIRRSYWCGIAFLEARGAWQPDPSRTPREYLALVPDGPPAAGLVTLTGLLERAWYGRTIADASSFDEAVNCLRSMGCPVA